MAGKLFDATLDLHNLGGEERLLLETAALLHDIGHFVNVSKHHKHTYYLLTSTPIVDLSETQMAIVANVARYHRMALPNPRHDGYAALPPRDRAVVSKLAALLRVADAMDTEHEARVADFSLEIASPQCVLRLKGEGDLLLEKWKITKKSALFEEVFNLKLLVE
ncbi:MAG: HD domain-containing protein [Nitrospinae bacterium]|nr:HD domain-containing protein [Nitrospinota bacterium]